ncbi:nucleotidyltransferase family protein [Cutibacterium avidum]|uniref:nucleotidyltransferase family protein n=1 Tax=Cutibacterium avidum TaxID=33010 RepID=UPI0008F56BDB|nr:nucleotidyltransferase family protein [Cutibacterium avidum]MCO6660663.1 nucleotidyltransferase family protein [Cutibacterium avidum]MDK7698046.1 nucleotidyltransferase family protein [Cutibacterium avidum]OIJ79778.1 glucose-1-phosphate thymidylyltransferase [Cutibacterium avidum]
MTHDPVTQRAPRKAVIMARGLGTRMRKAAVGVSLTAEQASAAQAGVKAMISLDGRPFLDYVISSLADAGFDQFCLVIGPEHDLIRNYYDSCEKSRVEITYAIQEQPLGTADAVAAAEDFAGDDRALVVNSDNFYPEDAVARLREVPASATLGFTKRAMIDQSNIDPERIRAFALLDSDDSGQLTDIIEKPAPEVVDAAGETALVSMNCFLLTPRIFEACRSIEKSARGEYEIVDAVRWMVEQGERFAVVPVEAGVLDMSNRGDIASVVDALGGREVKL